MINFTYKILDSSTNNLILNQTVSRPYMSLGMHGLTANNYDSFWLNLIVSLIDIVVKNHKN